MSRPGRGLARSLGKQVLFRVGREFGATPRRAEKVRLGFEIDAVRRLMAGQELVTIISYEELAGAAQQTAGSFATAAASVYLVESPQN